MGCTRVCSPSQVQPVFPWLAQVAGWCPLGLIRSGPSIPAHAQAHRFFLSSLRRNFEITPLEDSKEGG